MASDGPDPALFALATLLPVSCFPSESVHQNARYETKRSQPCQHGTYSHSGKNLAKSHHAYNLPTYTMPKSSNPSPYGAEMQKPVKDSFSSASGTGHRKFRNVQFLPHIVQNESPKRYSILDEEVPTTMPPLSASTTCSDQAANWSSSELSSDLETPRMIEPKPLGSAGEPFVLSNSYSDLSPNSCIFAGATDDMSGDPTEDICNESTSYYLGSTQPRQVVSPLDTLMATSAFCPSFPAVYTDESVSEIPAPVEPSSFPVAAVSMSLEPSMRQPIMPPWESQTTTDPSPKHIDGKTNGFLNGTGSAINWDDIEPCLRDAAFAHQCTVNKHHVNSISQQLISGQGRHHPQEYHPLDITSPEDTWCTCIPSGAESFSTFAELLHEHRSGQFAPVEKRQDLN